MKLINTDGMAFIGPGSEWFWAAFSGIALAITFIAIYRQLRLQRAAEAIRSITDISREWGEERLTRARLETLLALKAGEDLASLPVAADIANFWETVGYLTRARHIDRMLLHQTIGPAPISWWIRLKPGIVADRERLGEQAISEHFEWLATTMAAMFRKAGSGGWIDEAYLTAHLDRDVGVLRGQIAQHEALRAVIVRPMSPLAAPEIVPDAAPAA